MKEYKPDPRNQVTDNMLGLMYKFRDKVYNAEVESDSIELTKNVNIIDRVPDQPKTEPDWKYSEDKILDDFRSYLASTYGEHYSIKDQDIQCFDAWIAMGDATPTFRNTAIKYLWRYGKKSGNNKKDLLKALHYVLLCLHNDHYKE